MSSGRILLFLSCQEVSAVEVPMSTPASFNSVTYSIIDCHFQGRYLVTLERAIQLTVIQFRLEAPDLGLRGLGAGSCKT